MTAVHLESCLSSRFVSQPVELFPRKMDLDRKRWSAKNTHCEKFETKATESSHACDIESALDFA